LKRFEGKLAKVGLERGPFTPHLFRSLAAMGYPMVCMDARRAAGAIKSRRLKSDKAAAFALAEMLRRGWFSPVHLKSIDSHKIKTLLGARDQLVKAKRAFGNQGRGLLRPFGVRLPSGVGAKKFAEAAYAAYEATQADPLMHAGIAALLEALASIDAPSSTAASRSWRAATRSLGGR
jgi:transposase